MEKAGSFITVRSAVAIVEYRAVAEILDDLIVVINKLLRDAGNGVLSGGSNLLPSALFVALHQLILGRLSP